MMGKRLHLWRLSNFNIERLPSVEDVYLFHAVARDNPKDERLFACAEVRDLTPVRDETGRIVQLPHLERMLTEALAGIRLFQSRRRPQERLYWNRILLYVWPPLTLKRDELRRHRAQTGSCDRRPGTGTGGGTRPHSESADRRVARHGGAHFEPGRHRVAHDLPARATNCSRSNR